MSLLAQQRAVKQSNLLPAQMILKDNKMIAITDKAANPEDKNMNQKKTQRNPAAPLMTAQEI